MDEPSLRNTLFTKCHPNVPGKVVPMRDAIKCTECADGLTRENYLSDFGNNSDFVKAERINMNRVSFQGERGSISVKAIRQEQFFADKKLKQFHLPTFSRSIRKHIYDGKEQIIPVIPVENSLEGSVGESYDLLYSTSLNATGEIYHKELSIV